MGISIDGPAELHDRYRLDKKQRPTHAKVMEGLRLLQEHRVEYNVLCVVHRGNVDYPLEVYRFFKEHGVEHLQFIPLVERGGRPGFRTGRCRPKRTAVFSPRSLTNGSVATSAGSSSRSSKSASPSGSAARRSFASSPRRAAGRSSSSTTAIFTRATISWTRSTGWAASRGLRFTKWRRRRYFFNYIDPYMKEMAALWRRGEPPARLMEILRRQEEAVWAGAGRNAPCPCGSGRKYKKCCLHKPVKPVPASLPRPAR